MKLLTRKLRERLPPLYAQQEVEDPMVHIKFFTPGGDFADPGLRSAALSGQTIPLNIQPTQALKTRSSCTGPLRSRRR